MLQTGAIFGVAIDGIAGLDTYFLEARSGLSARAAGDCLPWVTRWG